MNEWKEKQRYLEEVGEAPLEDNQKRPLLISILPVNVTEHLLKSAAMRRDVEELEKELLVYLAMIDQQNRKAIVNLNSVADSADHNDQEEPIYEYTEPWWDDSYQIAVGHFTRECPTPSGKGKGKNWLPPEQWTHHNPGFIPKQWNYWRPGNSKGKGKGPDQSYGKGGVSVMGQEGLFNFPQLGCVNPTQWQHDYWNANEVGNCGEGNWPGRLAHLCKTKKIEKIERVSQFAEAAEQFQLVKKGKTVSWKRLDCQDELHDLQKVCHFDAWRGGARVRRGYNKYRW